MTSKKQKVKNKNKFFLLLPIVSLILLVLSTWFLVNVKTSQKIKGLKENSSIPIPLGARKISEDKSNNNSEIAYATKLSPNQIQEFYRTYFKLEDWERISKNKYQKGEQKLIFFTKKEKNETVVKVIIE